MRAKPPNIEDVVGGCVKRHNKHGYYLVHLDLKDGSCVQSHDRFASEQEALDAMLAWMQSMGASYGGVAAALSKEFH